MATLEAAVLSSTPLEAVPGESVLDADKRLDAFFAEVEKRAFRMARFAVGDPDDALDITQDAMIRLATRYAEKPPGEWHALFFRILQNRIRDHQRRGSVRSRIMAWLPAASGDEDDASRDPVQNAPDPGAEVLPERSLEMQDVAEALEQAVAALPLRQQQTFMLRAWEGLDVKSTARAMGCSEGSVKTHYSRAIHSLRARLGEHFDD